MKTYDWVRRDVVKAGGAAAALAAWAAPLAKAFGKSKPMPAPLAPIGAVLVDPRYADSRAFADELVARGARAFSTETDLAELWRGELGALYAKGGVRVAGLTPHSDLFLSTALASEAGPRATCSFEGWHDCRGAEVITHAVEGGDRAKGLAGDLNAAGAGWAKALAVQVAEAAAQGKPTVRDAAPAKTARGVDHPGSLVSWVIG